MHEHTRMRALGFTSQTRWRWLGRVTVITPGAWETRHGREKHAGAWETCRGRALRMHARACAG